MKPPTFPSPEVRGKGHQSHGPLSLSNTKRRLTSFAKEAKGTIKRFFSSSSSPSSRPHVTGPIDRPGAGSVITTPLKIKHSASRNAHEDNGRPSKGQF